jgi:hypothetical protein
MSLSPNSIRMLPTGFRLSAAENCKIRGMAERIALWGRDIDESPLDPTDTQIDSGPHDPITEPIPVVSEDSGEYVEDESDGYRVQYAPDDELTGYVEDEPTDHYEQLSHPEGNDTAYSYAKPFIDRRPGSPGSSLTFKPPPAPWYRTRRGLIVLIAVIVVAVVLAIIPMLLRGPSGAPTNVTPTTEPAPSSVAPTTNSVAPTLTSQPAPPPPPPPPPASPPPPPPVQDAPVYQPRYQAPRGGSESQPSKPEIGVTRAPISVSPKPVTPPTSAQVGRRNGDNTH